MKAIPAVIGGLLTVVLVLAAEAELSGHLLATALFTLLVMVLVLATYRLSLRARETAKGERQRSYGMRCRV